MECILGARGESERGGPGRTHIWHGANNRIQHQERGPLPHRGGEGAVARGLLSL